MTAALAVPSAPPESAIRPGREPSAGYPPAGLTPLAVALLTEFLPWSHDRVAVPDLPPAAVFDVLLRLEDLAVRHLMHTPAAGPATGRPALAVVPS